MVAVDAANGVGVDDGEGTRVELVLVARSSEAGVLGVAGGGRGAEAASHDLGNGKETDLLHERLEDADGRGVGVEDHVDLEALVFTAEEGLLVLVLAHVAEGVRLLAADGQGDPDVVEDLGLRRRPLGAGGCRVITWKRTVGGCALAAAGEVDLRQRYRVPGVVVHDLGRGAGGEDGLELHEEVCVLAKEVLDELQHLRAREDFLGVHV
mmetsp:Transcript_24208/g.50290  ORF Transcript_24208/g.50290 Transcript_24208/m.50290 type:complete len:209 (+) Transcript_24208:1507-2133(+)